jgi:excinuclease ABC subunit A
MSEHYIVVQGARQHNLKNITVRIPRNRLTVITGLSGSGKSSLAFDTLYAEGQRRYVESLSAYARQFLEQMEKPDVDMIEGLSPAIAIEQRTAGGTPRSTVATTTEIHDYLRLLFAHAGVRHCWKCGRPITRQTTDEIIERLSAWPAGTKMMLLAPRVQGRKGRHEQVFEQLRKAGFVRVRVDGELYDLERPPKLDPNRRHTIEVVVDRLVAGESTRARVADSVETALREGGGVMLASVQLPNEPQWTDHLYSQNNACVHCGLSFEELQPRHFSFNSPYGACSTCHGLGTVEVFDEHRIVPDPSRSLESGAIQVWRRGGRRLLIYYKMLLRSLAAHYGVSMDTPYSELPESFRKVLLYGSGDELVTFGFWRGGAWRRIERPFEGVIPNLERRLRETESDDVREWLRTFMSRRPCPACRGARLRPESLACKVAGQSIADVMSWPVARALEWIERLELPRQQAAIVGEVIQEIRARLEFLRDVGLDYLTLDRESSTLSGGEAQRIRLATQIGSGLVGVLYVLDEPSIGLHARDTRRLLDTLARLRDRGNTVVVVEHDEQTIRAADWVIDLGPGAGRHGGEVMFEGPVSEMLHAPTLTAQYLRGERAIEVPSRRVVPGPHWLEIVGPREHNLKGDTIRIPLGLLVCVTGVSGSGKSTLVDEILRKALARHLYNAPDPPGQHTRIVGLRHVDKMVVVDQSPIGRTPRSNPATYTGAFTPIRELFAQVPAARMRGYGPGRFSFNVRGGRCEACRGDGIIRVEMNFLPDVYVTCEQCGGRRFNRETLEIRYRGKSIADVLDMTVDEALDFFQAVPAIERRLRTLSEVGLGYIQLGQPATTLSGGEAQRVKLATELSRRPTGHTLYLLDEPTTGLHFADVERLLSVLERLRDAGNTVVVIEHNLDVIKRADWIIDLGPEGGEAGGYLVAEGPPEQVAECPQSHTGRALRPLLGKPASGVAS